MIQIPEKKQIYLMDDITGSSCARVVDQIHNMNNLDKQMVSYIESIGGRYTPPNIELYINSFGGSVHDALGLYDVIRSSYTPVTTIVTGSAMSAAGIVALAGEERYCTENSMFMIHSVAGWIEGKTETLREGSKEISKLQSILNSIILERTNITKQRLDEVNKRKLDWYIDARKAINLGIVQDIWA